MDERNAGPPPNPERIERREVVERSPAPERPAATPMWLWVLPLVVVVIALAWFIFTRGEPRAPFGDTDGRGGIVPEVTVPQPNVQVPTIEAPRSAEPAPAEPAPAEPPAVADPSPTAPAAGPD
jgi:hypothetical protein